MDPVSFVQQLVNVVVDGARFARDLLADWGPFIAALGAGLGAVVAWIKSDRSSRSADEARHSAEVATRALHTTTNQYAAQLMVEADRILIEHADLRPYFYGERPVATVPKDKRDQVAAVAELELDVMETIWDHHEEIDSDDVDAWREWMHEMFRSRHLADEISTEWYPSLAEMLAQHGCTDHLRHKTAVDLGRKIATTCLRDAALDLEDAADPRLVGSVASAEYLYNVKPLTVGVSGMRTRMRRAARDGDSQTAAKLERVIDALVPQLTAASRRAVILGAACRHLSPLPPLRGSLLSRFSERLRRAVQRVVRATPKTQVGSPELDALIDGEEFASEARFGRRMTLAEAQQFALEGFVPDRLKEFYPSLTPEQSVAPAH
jgi:hypothetical protein